MNAQMLARIQAHLEGGATLSDEEWRAILKQVADDPPAAPGKELRLVVLLLDSEPDRIDTLLEPDPAARVFAFLDAQGPAAESPRMALIRDAVLAEVGEPARARAREAAPTFWARIRASLAAGGFALATGIAGFWIGGRDLAPAPATRIASVPPAPPAAVTTPRPPVQLALLPAYSDDFFGASTGTKGIAVSGRPLQASVWFDRGDGTYRIGDRVRISVRVSRPAHGLIVELAADGELKVWPVPGRSPGGKLEEDKVHLFPEPPAQIVFDGPAGSDDLLLIATATPLPRAGLDGFVGTHPGLVGGNRADLLGRVRDVARAWARDNRVDIAFAGARALVRP